MSKGNIVLGWGKFSKNLGLAMLALSLVTYFDIWSKLNWYGSFIMIAAITLLVFQPKVTVKSDKVKVVKENED